MRRKRLAKTRMRRQLCDLRLPLPLHRRRDEVPVGGVADRRLEQIRERQLAEFLRTARQADTAPGTVTESQLRAGMVSRPLKWLAVIRFGARP